jgi:non-canonical purine NTP pyrophosphatase (RdgB/HAM1 family)
MLDNFPDKSARAECRIALKTPGNKSLVFIGWCDGTIVVPRGVTNFGWDPIFQPLNYTQTFAELDIEEKNKISHRGDAMNRIIDYFRSNPDWFTT